MTTDETCMAIQRAVAEYTRRTPPHLRDCDMLTGHIVRAIRDAPNSEGWIPMKERQPADFERVLCVNSAGYMTTANRFHDTKLDCWNGSDYTAEEEQELVIGGITHWMRLPEPPK